MTFDFISGILGFIDEVNIDRVVIDRYEDGLYKASVFVNCNKAEKRIDCRPTDAVSLALQMDVPVYVEDDIISCKCVNRTTMNEMDNKTLGTLIDNDHGSIFWNV
jgi:bifunctional DNase/RNase